MLAAVGAGIGGKCRSTNDEGSPRPDRPARGLFCLPGMIWRYGVVWRWHFANATRGLLFFVPVVTLLHGLVHFFKGGQFQRLEHIAGQVLFEGFFPGFFGRFKLSRLLAGLRLME